MIYVFVDGKWHLTGEDVNDSLTACEVPIPPRSDWVREEPDKLCAKCKKAADGDAA